MQIPAEVQPRSKPCGQSGCKNGPDGERALVTDIDPKTGKLRFRCVTCRTKQKKDTHARSQRAQTEHLADMKEGKVSGLEPLGLPHFNSLPQPNPDPELNRVVWMAEEYRFEPTPEGVAYALMSCDPRDRSAACKAAIDAIISTRTALEQPRIAEYVAQPADKPELKLSHIEPDERVALLKVKHFKQEQQHQARFNKLKPSTRKILTDLKSMPRDEKIALAVRSDRACTANRFFTETPFKITEQEDKIGRFYTLVLTPREVSEVHRQTSELSNYATWNLGGFWVRSQEERDAFWKHQAETEAQWEAERPMREAEELTRKRKREADEQQEEERKKRQKAMEDQRMQKEIEEAARSRAAWEKRERRVRDLLPFANDCLHKLPETLTEFDKAALLAERHNELEKELDAQEELNKVDKERAAREEQAFLEALRQGIEPPRFAWDVIFAELEAVKALLFPDDPDKEKQMEAFQDEALALTDSRRRHQDSILAQRERELDHD